MSDREILKDIVSKRRHMIALNTFDIDWLLEQAEELHGTKGRYGYKGMWALCNRDYGRLNAENERYKQAMEKIRGMSKDSVIDRKYFQVANEALEVEKLKIRR